MPRRPPPSRVWIVRHGESAGNVALREAEAGGLHEIDVSRRDADVPLSPLGQRQSEAVGRWLGALPEAERPTRIYSSPYLRSRETAKHLISAGGLAAVPFRLDERLREKEFGVLNRLTRAGILAAHPEQAELRAILGKLYYRPPGGESWCDIILRLRSFWDTLRLDDAGERVLVVCHSVITLCLRYILEELDEAQVLSIDQATDVANCSITSYRRSETDDGGGTGLTMELFNFVAPLEEAGEQVTRAEDAPLPK
jgi:2,3-bisphosphoglycerate-dependent phosphoglycerate mutase